MLAFLRDRKVRDILWQAAATIALVAIVWFFVRNASENMMKAGIASGFKFLKLPLARHGNEVTVRLRHRSISKDPTSLLPARRRG